MSMRFNQGKCCERKGKNGAPRDGKTRENRRSKKFL